eukprot:g8106.t1
MTEPDGRYDRQLRIWGTHGQRQLESARICVINSSATSSETLKNLVLGGIQSFTLIDEMSVTDSDFGNNYLVDLESLGQSRAETVAKLLHEFNPSISANVITESIEETLKTQPRFFEHYSLIIATQLTPSRAKAIVKKCEEFGVPFINVRSYGFIGYIQLHVDEICIVESKPDDQVPDLRLATPWNELTDFVNSFDFENLEDVQHSHLPFIILLIKSLELWKKTNEDTLPTKRVQQDAFKAIINGLRRSKKNPSIEEENFDEAVRNAYQVWTPYEIPKSVREILQDGKTLVHQNSPEFWILVHALKSFVSETGFLPLNGSIPDMTSTTEYYLTLQGIYNKKAEADLNRLSTLVKDTLHTLDKPSHTIPSERISLFCKNARNLRVVRSRPRWFLEDSELIMNLRKKEQYQTYSLGLMMEAADLFYEKHARFPGVLCGDDWMQDVEILINLLHSTVDLSGLDKELKSELQTIALEVCRWGGAEFHNVAAIMGGIASQEAIKILTHQFVPLSGCLFYNGMSSTTTTLP